MRDILLLAYAKYQLSKLCGIMANDNELTADGAGNGNGNNEQVITKNANDSTQKMDTGSRST